MHRHVAIELDGIAHIQALNLPGVAKVQPVVRLLMLEAVHNCLQASDSLRAQSLLLALAKMLSLTADVLPSSINDCRHDDSKSTLYRRVQGAIATHCTAVYSTALLQAHA